MVEAYIDRLRSFLSTADVPKGMVRDIQALIDENVGLRHNGVPPRWEKLVEYFQLNEIDMVLYFHSRMGRNYWTCMLWAKNSAWAEADGPETAMEKAFLKLKNVVRED